MAVLVTTLGDKTRDEVGYILPHEHIFADFVAGDDGGKTSDDVLPVIQPAIAKAQATGLGALVDATAIGGARRVDILKDVSEATSLPIVVATGIFKDPHKADWVKQYGEDGLVSWMIGELTDGVDHTGVRAGWIKLSVTDDGVTDYEQVLLRSATRASIETSATIGSHTVSGRLALDQLDIIEAAGGRPDRFIWVHTQVEPDDQLHLEVARRGAWLEYDNIGVSPDDNTYADFIIHMIDAGYCQQLLLSHDCGGYNPHTDDGRIIASYTYLRDQFLPILRGRGVDEGTITQLTRVNPFNAYAR